MIVFPLIRKYLKPEYTIGKLLVHGMYYCDILEDPVRDFNKDGDLDDPGEEKIYKDTAIPYFMYEVIISYSPKFGRDLPLLLNVKHFEGIRIHGTKSKVATNKNTWGCLIPGENKIKGGVIKSLEYEERIIKMIQAYKKAGEKVFINII